jgi:phosphoribosylglycinamide formyltransferase-1
MTETSRTNQNNHSSKNIAIFASGAGSNAEKIICYFKDKKQAAVKLIVCNKEGAGVIQIAADNNLPVLLIEKERFFRGDGYVVELQQMSIDFIVLAGFLWKIPATLTDSYSNRIINIHPALLPKYGGKGMYGSKVHAAVIEAGETESGITIHYVDEHYDNGKIIFQATCPVLKDDTADDLAHRIHLLEHENFPRVVDECISKLS